MATITNRGLKKNGSWSFLIRIDRGYDSKGNRLKRESHTWNSRQGIKESTARKEAEKYAYELEEQIKRGRFISDKRTFSEYMDYVLETKLDSGMIKKSTYSNSLWLGKKIKAEIGNIKVVDLKPIDITNMLSSIRSQGNSKYKDKPISEKTIREYFLLVSSILDFAFREGVVNENVASRVPRPRIKRKEVTYYEEHEIKAILEAAKEEPIRTQLIINLLCYTGLRRGELLGLEWKNLNEETQTIKIEKNIQYTSKMGVYVDEPKTEKSKRTLPLTPSLMQLFKEYKQWQLEYQKLKFGEYFIDEGYIFTQDNGKPIHPDNIDRFFAPMEKKHPELPHIRCHKFRHSIATWLIGEGNDIASVSAMLGHSSPNTTLGTYTHATERGRESIVKSLSTLQERIS